jgi:hypothetical protein
MPYGMLYPRKPSNSVQLFVRALQEQHAQTTEQTAGELQYY